MATFEFPAEISPLRAGELATISLGPDLVMTVETIDDGTVAVTLYDSDGNLWGGEALARFRDASSTFAVLPSLMSLARQVYGEWAFSIR